MRIKDLCQNYQTIGDTIKENCQPSTEIICSEMNHKNLMMFISLYIPDLARKHYIFEYIAGLCDFISDIKMNHAQRESFIYTGMHQTCHIEEVVQDDITAIAGSVIRYIGCGRWVNFFDNPEHFHVQQAVTRNEETLNTMTGKVTYQDAFYLNVSW